MFSNNKGTLSESMSDMANPQSVSFPTSQSENDFQVADFEEGRKNKVWPRDRVISPLLPCDSVILNDMVVPSHG